MLLTLLVAVPAALGPLLRGSWDPWAQTLVASVVAVGGSAWLALRVCLGYVPLPSARARAWLAGLAALAALSAWRGPLSGEAPFELPVLLVGLGVVAATAVLSKDERETVDQAVRAAAWVLMTLAVYQRWGLGAHRPESALLNANTWAGAVLMLIPVAADRRDWLLVAGLGLCLWWTKSVGAWMAFFAALLLTARWRGEAKTWAALAGALVCLVAVYNKFQSPEVLDRLAWWRAAAAMAADRPWLGAGPGAYAAALPGYHESGLTAVYAHQWPLQTAAEYGLPFALLWFAGLWRLLFSARSYKRFGALAALLHSLWDWPLSVPGNLWLFCYLAACSVPESGEGAGVRGRWRLPAAAAALWAGAWAASAVFALWAADRARAQAAFALGEGRLLEAQALAADAAARRPRDSESPLVYAHAALGRAAAGEDPALHLTRAAEAFEASLRLDPYRPRAWRELAAVYRRLGDEPRAVAALARGGQACPVLRRRPGG
ncbi:hypothetical protein EPO15_10225 [bacterium]|nr:MAG: hypothetical protein EPO15_10225 [bacterium]